LWRGYFTLDERENRIRVAAYYRYLKRGCRHGHDLDDWLAAEAEIDFGAARARTGTAAELEIQQSAVHGAAEDDTLKHIARQHPQKAIPRVESIEPAEAPFKL
jgi:hypothetical protein